MGVTVEFISFLISMLFFPYIAAQAYVLIYWFYLKDL